MTDADAAIDDSQALRRDVRRWLEANAPRKGDPDDFSSVHVVAASTPEEYDHREQHALAVTRDWQRRLFDAGLAGRSWPVAYGGQGRPDWQDHVVAEEQARFGVSTKMLAIALEMLPPVLFAHGTEELRATHLPRVLRGEESWCQLLSEPEAGSDLANVRTMATRVEAGWSVSGQKVWTSGAGCADFALLVARTDRPESGRAGLSCFALDMSRPGVEVRPLRQMSGAYHFNEVFLDDVLVPEGALIGELGGGWAVLRTMLASERAAIGGGTSARSAVPLVALAQHLGRAGEPLVRHVLVEAVIRERLIDLVRSRLTGPQAVPAGGPISKLMYSEHARLSADAATRILGPAATAGGNGAPQPRGSWSHGAVGDHPDAAPWVERLLFAPGLRIGGGTDEIQRNVIAERGLGLPREPR